MFKNVLFFGLLPVILPFLLSPVPVLLVPVPVSLVILTFCSAGGWLLSLCWSLWLLLPLFCVLLLLVLGGLYRRRARNLRPFALSLAGLLLVLHQLRRWLACFPCPLCLLSLLLLDYLQKESARFWSRRVKKRFFIWQKSAFPALFCFFVSALVSVSLLFALMFVPFFVVSVLYAFFIAVAVSV